MGGQPWVRGQNRNDKCIKCPEQEGKSRNKVQLIAWVPNSGHRIGFW